MNGEEKTLSALTQRFPELIDAGRVPAARRIFVSVPSGIFMEALRFAAEELGFTHLCTITGLDAGDCFEVIYHLSSDEGVILSLTRRASREEPVIETVLPVFHGATFYERELEGMLGLQVAGLPEGRQYPLPDGWPQGQYPLRKEWTPEQMKQDVRKEEESHGKD